jgi:YVTN family beta-propeller protein
MTSRATRRLRRIPLVVLTVLASSAAVAGPLLWQTSSEGDDIHIFDLESRQLVRRLVVGPQPHGIAAPADARVIYVAVEANDRPRGELLWIDPRVYRIEHRMEICREPHAIATTPDGRWAVVALAGANQVTVVDAASRDVVAELPTGAGPKRNLVIDLDPDYAGDPSRSTRY